MPSAHDSVHDRLIQDILLRVEINPPLPCGIDGCGLPARCGRVERDPRFGSLWNLLPICEAHQESLAAAATGLAGAPHHQRLPDE